MGEAEVLNAQPFEEVDAVLNLLLGRIKQMKPADDGVDVFAGALFDGVDDIDDARMAASRQDDEAFAGIHGNGDLFVEIIDHTT